MLRINLLSGPRNVSTALMYSFAQRSDTQVWDEPLYAHYLRVTDADHPGRDETLASMDSDGERVVREVLLGAAGHPVLFFKQMAHHHIGLDLGFLRDLTNILLIRHPAEVINSFSQVIPHPTMTDIGIARQAGLYDLLRHMGQQPLVLDGNELLKAPREMLTALCAGLGIPFDPAMLAWPPGPRPEDGCWAPYWYASVHRSTGFAPYRERPHTVAPQHQALLDAALPYYTRLSAVALRAR
ncbi:MAG: branched chain amino acid aminotransferase [Bacteroidia bacterium]